VDKEELREDKAVKISKKELKTLIAELDEFADQYTKQQQQQQQQQTQQQQKIPKKKRTPDTSFTSIENISSVNTNFLYIIY
jgi:transcription initiation factor TFIID subunit TAF12